MATNPFDIQPTLEDDLILLRPLKPEDYEALYKVASDPLIWEQHPAYDRYQEPVFKALFADAILSGGAFGVIDKASGNIIGSTRYHAIEETMNAIEIGWTFIGRAYWGGRHNQAMKKLLIENAFKYVDHVIFYIGDKNLRSQKAVEKIGGKRITAIDGIAIHPRPSASVNYSISKKDYFVEK